MNIVRTVRKHLRPIKRVFDQTRIKLLELPYRFKDAPAGSAEWLIRAEVTYGGLVTDVARLKVSPLDPRSAPELAFGGMTGGDRMLHNDYAPIYARFLKPFIGKPGLSLAEFGILKGTGLAIWCDLFPDALVLGLDIDSTHFAANREELLRRGAFRLNNPAVHEYDQLVDGHARLQDILHGKTLDVVIDDGLHSVEAIMKTFHSVRPHLSQRFVYFIEDYPGLLDQCGSEFSSFDCHAEGRMTIVSAGIP